MENWIAEVVGKMHIHAIRQEELANQLGVRRDYLNKILNGKETPKGAKERIEAAIDSILSSRK